MATTKKTVKVRDLKPTKDAKGGSGHHVKPNTHKIKPQHGHHTGNN